MRSGLTPQIRSAELKAASCRFKVIAKRFSFKVTKLALFYVLLTANPTWAAILEGAVVGVSDGDTITVLTDRKQAIHVRVMGIDAPEKKQAFGQQSKQAMSECSFGKTASVDWSKIDRYGRTIGKVMVEGVDCGLRQIELGLAWHYKTYEREQSPVDREKYAGSHERARGERRGLWSDPNPIPPWEYRHSAVNH